MNYEEKFCDMIDSEGWKAYLIAALLIALPTIIHIIFGKY